MSYDLAILAQDFLFSETPTSIPALGSARLCFSDATRFTLAFANSSSNLVVATTDPNVSGTKGIPLIQTAQPFILNFRDHSVMAQQAWFAFNTTGVVTNINVWQVLYQPRGASDNIADYLKIAGVTE